MVISVLGENVPIIAIPGVIFSCSLNELNCWRGVGVDFQKRRFVFFPAKSNFCGN